MPSENVDHTQSRRPGEFVHYYANLLTLLRNRYAPGEIRQMASAAVSLRERRIDEFSRHLEATRTFFDGLGAGQRLAPHLIGWDVEKIEDLRQRHGGLLLAVFHYGEHRHVLSDLCRLGIQFVAPVAKRSYFDAPAVFSNGPTDCATAPLMLEVESRSVGRSLLTSLKRGRIGLIYVDGNMGPDGHLVDESGVEIDFFDRRIRVKSGIARLAMAMRLPIVPVFAIPDLAAPNEPHRLLALPEILPVNATQTDASAREETRRIMQKCYDGLAVAVATAPQYWEFAFCLHRWLCAGKNTAPAATSPPPTDPQQISIDPSIVIPYPSHDAVYWLHLERQRAYRLPSWSHGLYDLLRHGPRDLNEVIPYLQKRTDVSWEPWQLLGQMRALELIQTATRFE